MQNATIVIDKKSKTAYNVLEQWDTKFPPLNLWNYSLHWRWVLEFEQEKEQEREHASRRSVA